MDKSEAEEGRLSERVAALEKQLGEIGPTVIRALDERLEVLMMMDRTQQQKPLPPTENRSYASVTNVRSPPSTEVHKKEPARGEE